MKKVFSLNSSNSKPGRQTDDIRYEINKYFKRESRKKHPLGFKFWEFNCKIDITSKVAKVVNETDINDSIDKIIADKKSSFYMEIIAQPVNKPSPKSNS